MKQSSSVNPHYGIAGKMDVILDPRLPIYGNATEISNFSACVDLPYGLTEVEAGGIANSEVSLLGDNWRTQNLANPIHTIAQVLYSRAETAQRGWTSEDPTQLYYDGIVG